MSTSLVYHAFGAKSYRYLRSDYDGGKLYLHLEKKDKHRCCAACRSRDITFDGNETSTVKTLPIGRREVFLVLHLKVLVCRKCGARRNESRDVADPRKSYTRAFARFALDLLREMTMYAAAIFLRVGWDLVKEILRSNLQRRADRRSFRKVRRIAIDEIAIRKGQDYMTVVLDLDTGRVLFAAEGKDAKCLEPFFRRLRRARAKLEAVAMDMSEAYAKAVREYWKKPVAVVHDHFHLIAAMNKVIEVVRREEQNRLEREGKQVLKGIRYLLLYGREKLAERKPEKLAKLDEQLATNDTLNRIYLLKESLRLAWSHGTKQAARDFLDGWIAEARGVGNKRLSTFADTLEKNAESALAWYDHPITTGPLEGLNNKIKVLKRKAYGYRDMVFFALRLLFIHEAKMELAGC
jgi:transposase